MLMLMCHDRSMSFVFFFRFLIPFTPLGFLCPDSIYVKSHSRQCYGMRPKNLDLNASKLTVLVLISPLFYKYAKHIFFG